MILELDYVTRIYANGIGRIQGYTQFVIRPSHQQLGRIKQVL